MVRVTLTVLAANFNNGGDARRYMPDKLPDPDAPVPDLPGDEAICLPPGRLERHPDLFGESRSFVTENIYTERQKS